MVPSEDIERRFSFHPASTQDTQNRHQQIRDMCKEVAHELNTQLTDGREKSLAMTHLEEVMMWSNAAIAREGN